ncbi:type 1 glutamine amidotransferase [Hyphomicrobium facile]|uniref:GMP synthase (Glutamine-hydrolysing) n=1 Tax=Hyphomicrobium facile TaxID=51670 RepID=A0A1I7MWF7_9HYPH|nr:type 1 glutamine amidotransferase [Hyphomicrobium facile]SFV26752.1 GMP synthase (glutamine-hydrolysing) [Hyphomicrobium facile]
MLPVLIVQNDPLEGAGSLATLMAKRGLSQFIVQGFDAPYAELTPERFSALIILGGAQSAYETETYPYLEREMDLVNSFIKTDMPVAGFCLGAQILAAALGGDVGPGAQKEIGWYDLTLCDEAADDALLKGHPKTLLSYHFHGDVIRNVPNSIVLASSAMTPWQAFRHGQKTYGFQYHAEVNRSLLADMCRNNESYLASNGIDADTLIVASQPHLPDFEHHCAGVLERWLDLFSIAK